MDSNFFGFRNGLRTSGPFPKRKFSKGKYRWEGDGRIAFIKTDDSIESADDAGDPVLDSDSPDGLDGKIPIIEIKLAKFIFRQLSQSFTTEPGTHSLKVSVVFKATSDYKRNNKSSSYTPGLNWPSDDSVQIYSGYFVFPKTDLLIRFDRIQDYASYRMVEVKPGADWQTVSFTLPDVSENVPVAINIFPCPGEGTIYIKSVSIAK